MTDAEIIKAANCCFCEQSCKGCPLDSEIGAPCVVELRKSVVDLLTRQSAEIERLNGVTVQGWISVEDRLPEDDPNIKRYLDGHISLMSVLVCGGSRGVNIANRVYIKPVGIPYLDEQATNEWVWSAGNEDVTHWMPLPEPPKGE